MLSNGAGLILLSLSIVVIGFTGFIVTKNNPHGIVNNMSVVVMASGLLMTCGIIVLSLISAFLIAIGSGFNGQ